MTGGTDPLGSKTIEAFLEALASDSPTPGGGAVAALAGAAGAALISMVANLTADRKGFEDHWDRMRAIATDMQGARLQFLSLADRDAAAFDAVMEAIRMPKGTDDEREARRGAMQLAFAGAAAVPLEIAMRAADVMPLAAEVVETGNENAASDGAAGAQMLFAAVRIAVFNVEINAVSMNDDERVGQLRADVLDVTRRAERLLADATEAFGRRVG